MDNFDDAPIAGASTHRPDKWAEENRREQALRMAIEAGRGVPACDIVHTAAMFEAFLRDGTVPGSWQQESAAREQRLAKQVEAEAERKLAQAYREAVRRADNTGASPPPTEAYGVSSALGLNTSTSKD